MLRMEHVSINCDKKNCRYWHDGSCRDTPDDIIEIINTVCKTFSRISVSEFKKRFSKKSQVRRS